MMDVKTKPPVLIRDNKPSTMTFAELLALGADSYVVQLFYDNEPCDLFLNTDETIVCISKQEHAENYIGGNNPFTEHISEAFIFTKERADKAALALNNTIKDDPEGYDKMRAKPIKMRAKDARAA